MAKKVTAVIKLQCPAQKATPAPPIGPALGPHGVSAPKFVQEFNERSKKFDAGLIVPVVISVYADRTFSFILKTPPASILIKKGTPNKTKVGKLTKAQLEDIAKQKLDDMNCNSLESAMKVVAGTARSMGVEVEK